MPIFTIVQDKKYKKEKLRERHYEKSERKDKKERFDEVLKKIKEGELIFPPKEEDPNVVEAYLLAAESGYSHETIERSITEGYSNNLVSIIKKISEQRPLGDELIKEGNVLAKFLIYRATKENQEKEFKELIDNIHFSVDKPLNPRHYSILQRARGLKIQNNYFIDGKTRDVLDNLERRLEKEVMNNEDVLFTHLYLTQKTTEVLKKNAIFTFNELLSYSEDELNMLKEWDRYNTEKIKEALSTVNLELFFQKNDAASEHLEKGKKYRTKFGGKLGKHQETMDRMIENGAKLEEIAKMVGVTRERIRQYVVLTGQYEKRKSAKETKVETKVIEKRIKQDLSKALLNYTIKRADEEGYGEVKKYYFDKDRPRIRRISSLEKIINLVKIYHQAQRNGEKIGYRKLAKMTGIFTGNFPEVGVQRILSEMGLPSLHWTHPEIKRKIIHDKKKNNIKKAFPKMSYIKNYSDIAYFTDISIPSIKLILGLGKKNNRDRKHLSIRNFGRPGRLTYKYASQIYAFKDEFNATEEEITDVLGVNKKIVSYAIEHRNEIEPKIINDLRLMFPKERIDKPYR